MHMIWNLWSLLLINYSCLVGEDVTSVEAHVKVLQEHYKKLHCDTNLVKDCMMKTHAWRCREIAEGMSTEDFLKRYPFLRTFTGLRRAVNLMLVWKNDRTITVTDSCWPIYCSLNTIQPGGHSCVLQIKYPLFLLSQLCDEVNALHPSPVGICRRFTPVLWNVLKLIRDCNLKRLYLEACGDALTEDITGMYCIIVHTNRGLTLRPWKHRACHCHGNINQTLLKCFCTQKYLFVQGIEFRGGLLLLPSIFKEKMEDLSYLERWIYLVLCHWL